MPMFWEKNFNKLDEEDHALIAALLIKQIEAEEALVSSAKRTEEFLQKDV